jgi:hypothetical protein
MPCGTGLLGRESRSGAPIAPKSMSDAAAACAHVRPSGCAVPANARPARSAAHDHDLVPLAGLRVARGRHLARDLETGRGCPRRKISSSLSEVARIGSRLGELDEVRRLVIQAIGHVEVGLGEWIAGLSADRDLARQRVLDGYRLAAWLRRRRRGGGPSLGCLDRPSLLDHDLRSRGFGAAAPAGRRTRGGKRPTRSSPAAPVSLRCVMRMNASAAARRPSRPPILGDPFEQRGPLGWCAVRGRRRRSLAGARRRPARRHLAAGVVDGSTEVRAGPLAGGRGFVGRLPAALRVRRYVPRADAALRRVPPRVSALGLQLLVAASACRLRG